jgi:acyl-CoA dehydrogenase
VIEWTDEQQMVRAAVRDFIEKELVPHHRDLEHGDLPPYDIIRKLFSTFGMDAMARDRFARQIAATAAPTPAARTRTRSAIPKRPPMPPPSRSSPSSSCPAGARAWSRPWGCP